MLDNSGFDSWSGKYDQDILVMQEQGYPFEGYYNTLGSIQHEVVKNDGKTVLDIGIGTGLLSEELYKSGMNITGIDFSNEMIKKAQKKMPSADFVQADFSKELPEEILGKRFDYIVSSYALHHITDNAKVDFIRALCRLVTDQGKILIGDVSFQTRADLERVKQSTEGWDEDEYYFVADELVEELSKAGIQSEYVTTSSCSGVLTI